MRVLFFIGIIIVCGCKNSTTKKVELKIDSSAKVSTKTVILSTKIGNSKFHTSKDSIVIYSKDYNIIDKTIYSKNEFNEIVDYFPSLYESSPKNPDSTYNKSEKQFIDSNGNIKKINFGGEAGWDEYCILYAYFLQKQNQGKGLTKRRENIINIFNGLNNIFDILYHGGTGYGHNYKRINGYAEYAVYQFKSNKNYYLKTNKINNEKKIFLSNLRQKIKKEISTDNMLPIKDEKEKEEKRLLKYVGQLDLLITDNFYLKKAIEYQQSNNW